jgi:hypothetical protein
MKKEHKIKIKYDYEFDEYDIEITKMNFFKISFGGLFTGIIAGMLGMGAGLVLK